MKNIRVLIAADSPLQSRSLQRMIGQGGHQIIRAGNGLETMTHLDGHGVDLCFLQDALPDQSGLELCQTYAATSETERIPIVIFSRQPDIESAALAVGAADFLKMPCQTQEALTLVENWGSTIAESALCAVRTGLAMIETLATFNEGREETINIRVGINSGQVIIGDIGAKLYRRDYTVIGDHVNIAARLESAAEHGTVLISEATYHLIEDWVAAEMLGPIEVKGKSQPITVYQVEACLS